MSSGDKHPDKDKAPPPAGESRATFEGTKFEDDALQRVHSQLMREKEEPSENFSYPPLLLVFIFMILAFWAGVYLAEYSGGFSPFVFNEQLAGVGAADTGPRPPADPLVEGRKVYMRNCAACHQASGAGLPGVYPPLVNSDWVQDNPAMLTKVILSGLQGEIQVNGVTYSNAMTAFGPLLDDEDIAYVLTYIRTAPEFENASYAVSPELVSEVRADYGGQTEAWTQPELEAIHGPITGSWEPEGGAEVAPEADEAAPEADEAAAEGGPAAGDSEASAAPAEGAEA